ncbi:MAG TPA: hypothetical protein VLM40_10675, partial [Gemmata sp.]|nr:hypothetical protein [Gemmata sp.]
NLVQTRGQNNCTGRVEIVPLVGRSVMILIRNSPNGQRNWGKQAVLDVADRPGALGLALTP